MKLIPMHLPIRWGRLIPKLMGMRSDLLIQTQKGKPTVMLKDLPTAKRIPKHLGLHFQMPMD